MTVGCIVNLLQCAEMLHVLFKQLLILLLRFGQWRRGRGPLAQVQVLTWRYAVGLGIDRHVGHLSLQIRLAADNSPHGLAAGEPCSVREGFSAAFSATRSIRSCAAASETVSFSSFVTLGFSNCSGMDALSFHHDEPCFHQVLVSFAPFSASQVIRGLYLEK